jgi:hypothetical protein
LPTGKYITWAFGLPNAFANPYWPTATELNACLPLSQSLVIGDTDFGMQASNTNSQPTFADSANTETRGAAQYGGALGLLQPNEYDDNSNNHSLVFDAIGTQRTAGFIVMRIDGNKPYSQDFAAGDYVSVYQILTDGETLEVTGEEGFRYVVNALQQGVFASYSVVGTTSTPVVVTTPSATLAADVGDVGRVAVTVNGRVWTNGVDVSSSNSAVISIRKGAVWRAVAAGSATLTFSAPNSSATDTIAATITV